MIEYAVNLTLNEILDVEGIVIRKIPKETRRFGKGGTKEAKDNSLGGKYLVTLKHDQNSIVRFNMGNAGIGDTVQGAWRDLMLKGSY
jgi:hypothetical protein